MNSFQGIITNIEVSGSLSLVTVHVNDDISLKAIVIETPDTAPYLSQGNEVNVIFKETEVMIALERNLAISLQNRIDGTIDEIEKGELISKVSIHTTAGKVVSVISTNAINQLNLRQGTLVTAMIKLNEMMLSV